jgi:hypothetical protein
VFSVLPYYFTCAAAFSGFFFLVVGNRKEQEVQNTVTRMDPATVVRWAWPRSRGGVQAVCWRERLHEALQERLGYSPTLLNLQYQTIVVDDNLYRAVVDVDAFETPMHYEGATCDRQTTAINSAAWMALMDLCQQGLCTPPPEVCVLGAG